MEKRIIVYSKILNKEAILKLIIEVSRKYPNSISYTADDYSIEITGINEAIVILDLELAFYEPK